MTTPVDDILRCGDCGTATTTPFHLSPTLAVCDDCVRARHRCSGCGQITDVTSVTDNDGRICDYCERAERYHTCDQCDILIRDGYLCRTHAIDEADESFTCTRCSSLVPLRLYEPFYATDDRQLCPNCLGGFDLCDHCDHYDDALRSTETGRDLCDDCASQLDYTECGVCTTLIDGGTYCEDHRTDDDLDGLHDYGYKPNPVFHGIGPRYLGFELEVNVPPGYLSDRINDTVDTLNGLGYLKEDCSIDHGFELVTHPMAYRWALDSFPWHLLETLDLAGCSGDDLGLHVHISRAAFAGPCHVFRWMKFVYRNADDVQTLARRSSSYAAFRDSERNHIKDACKGNYYGDRSSAINPQPKHTLELRVFASSLDIQHVQAALAFADASVAYTRDLTIPDITQAGGWTWSAFTQWLLTRPQYAPLTAELENLACAC
ncbi:hypothetical protein VA596_47440 [Amycolatopsis sp., V23-08]|uniref:Amidoligase enzyme n=1 Tax=Amycolatopsis heterodermiae TaxID=3110235 RepID=A0ABU5RNT0_9PSEU|nr:hypothetical protein [Amycolatopsis sp., V23-08]MEA5367234.1 hypothetical protein [Amycolatopsis sp., V23-08]